MLCVLLVAWLPVTAPARTWAGARVLSEASVGGPDLGAYPWLYLRDGQPLAPGEEPAEVVLAGDVMPGRAVAAVEEPLAGVAPWLRAADLAVGNLECVLRAKGDAPPHPSGEPYRLRAPASAAAMLAGAGFDVLGLANNHALDYGPQALAATAALLGQAGVDTVGAGPGPVAALRPAVRDVRGLRLAFLAFNAVVSPDGLPAGDDWAPATWDTETEERVMAAVGAARATADAVIVSVHWGYEYDRRSDPGQRAMAQMLLEAGADLVVGHHPHVAQETATSADLVPEQGREGLGQAPERHRGQGFVAYSLGNLLFDQEQGDTRQGLALRAFFDEDGLRAVQGLPLQAGPRPRLLAPGPPPPAPTGEESAPPLLAERDLHGKVGRGADPTPVPAAQVPADWIGSGVTSGEIDLTGDGMPEEVRLEGDQVVVYEAGMEVWRGLPEWRVVDVALGDPNDDGRAEIVLALWKKDAGGEPRSHPFVVGYRGGAYRVLWGGSALARPIHEVALADVDGDDAQELLVLEEPAPGAARGQAPGERAVAAWRWHGWGFSLLWRGAP